MMRWRYFDLKEFDCKHCGKNEMDPIFIDWLDMARGCAGVPFKITSGYRCEEYDKQIGGRGNHPTGRAADILCYDSRHRYKIVEALLLCKFSRIGIGPNFIHVDCVQGKPDDVIWLY